MFATYLPCKNRDVPGVGEVRRVVTVRKNKVGHPAPITWAAAVTVIAALGLGFSFVLLLITVADVDYRLATATTLVLVVAVVSVLLPSRGRGMARRLAAALRAFLRAGPS